MYRELITSAAFRMARVEHHLKFGVAQVNGLAVLEDLVNTDGPELISGRVSEAIDLATAFEGRFVTGSRVHLGSGILLDLCHGGHVIIVRLHRQQDFNVLHLETELLDAGLDQWRGIAEAGIDEDVALFAGDEVAGEVLGADVVEVAGDLEGSDGTLPVFGIFGEDECAERG